jgi:hypothetical protein
LAQAANDRDTIPMLTPTLAVMESEMAPAEIAPAALAPGGQLVNFDGGLRPGKFDGAPEDQVLYSVLSDQIREMRRKSALPAVMCLAENNGDGTARTLPDDVMARLVSDNDAAGDGLFTLKQATACKTAGSRIIDAETRTRAVLVTAGPMEDDMKDLMSGCGDFVGGFVRASGDSDYDFYSVEGGDVARKLGCELAQ